MIGPAIPEGLLKKKPANENEIVMSFSDDEEAESTTIGPQIPTNSSINIGPQIPAHLQQNTIESSTNIGPQIPAHLLAKNKAKSEDITPSDEEDNIGPQIGPYIPKNLIKKKKETVDPLSSDRTSQFNEIVISDQEILADTSLSNTAEQDDINPEDFAPALPPDLLQQRQQKSQPTGRKRRIVGPTLPSGIIPPVEEDDYIVGPALPKDYNPEEESKHSAIQAIEERARQAREAMEKKEADKDKVQRPDWMLVPPEVDYLKKANSSKSRQFTNKTMTKEELDSSEWTLTPAQKQERLEENRSGKRQRNEEEPSFSKLDMERMKNIQQFNMQTRPLTLLEMHQQKKKKSKNTSDIEDVTKRAFDREKDLLGARKMDRKSKKELLKQSAQLGEKFGYGNSSFL